MPRTILLPAVAAALATLLLSSRVQAWGGVLSAYSTDELGAPRHPGGPILGPYHGTYYGWRGLPTRPLPADPGVVSAREWNRRLIDNLGNLQKQITQEVPGQRGKDLWTQAGKLYDQAVQLQFLLGLNVSVGPLQRYVVAIDDDLPPLVRALTALGPGIAPGVQRTAGSINYIEQHLFAALVPGDRSQEPMPRKIRLLSEEARVFSQLAAQAAQGNPDMWRLSDDADTFAWEAEQFRKSLGLGYVREPSRRDFSRVSSAWDRVQLDLTLAPQYGNRALFDQANRVSTLYLSLAGQLGIER
jgi:hypothetical protein